MNTQSLLGKIVTVVAVLVLASLLLSLVLGLIGGLIGLIFRFGSPLLLAVLICSVADKRSTTTKKIL